MHIKSNYDKKKESAVKEEIDTAFEKRLLIYEYAGIQNENTVILKVQYSDKGTKTKNYEHINILKKMVLLLI